MPWMQDPELLKRTASAIALASSIPGCTIAGGLLGVLIDRWLGSAPLGAVGLGAVGFATAVMQLLRTSRPPHDPPAPPPP